jgi:hypothetical protein
MRVAVAFSLILLLAGCFSSDGPLFGEARGKCPFTTPTTYEAVEPNSNHAPLRFLFETDGAYCKTTGPDDKITRTLFVPIGSGWSIVQGDEAQPSYLLIHVSGRQFTEYLPRCADFSASALRRVGVSFDENQNRCTATNAHQIEALFRSWRWGFHRASGAFRAVATESPAGSF